MEKKVVRKKKAIKKHIVVFQDYEGNVIDTVFVNDGDSVTPPEISNVIEEKEHEKTVFDHWDHELTSIHENVVVKPVYVVKPKEYLVMYFNENGKILGTETVPYGQSAVASYHPAKKETNEFRYHFVGWNQDLSRIEKDCMVRACFEAERKKFLVRFFGDGNVLLKEEFVEYGASAAAPEGVKKESDRTFNYSFQKWDEEFSYIIDQKDVHAIFRSEYIPYKISFFEEEKLIESKEYHYNDLINYPVMKKKGYEFIWNLLIDHVEEETEIKGYWQFSNRKGKQIKHDSGLYEIINPSVSAGAVRLVSAYENNKEVVKIPDQVKLGEYYYDVTNIGKYAFKDCCNVKKIICGNKIKILEKNCFKDSKRVREIVLGKNVSTIKEGVFSKCQYLRVVRMNGDKLPKIHRSSFEGMNRRVEVYVPARTNEQYCFLMRDAIREKNLLIQPY